MIWVFSFISLALAQIYRYRRVSTPLERQQTKWVVLGFTFTVLINIGSEVLSMIVPPLHQPGSFYTLFLTDITNRTRICGCGVVTLYSYPDQARL